MFYLIKRLMVFSCAVSLCFIIITGCQEILDEALTDEVTINQSIIQNQQIRTSIPVITTPTMLKNSLHNQLPDLYKAMDDESFEVSPPNPELFTELMLQEEITLIGQGDPNGCEGDLGIYFDPSSGLSDPQTSATLITEFDLNGLTTIDINVGAEMKPFFLSNLNIATFYLYLVHIDATAEITINSLKFVLPKPVLLEKVIHQDTSVTYEEVEGILNVKIGGEVTNLGSSQVNFIISVEANNPAYVAEWEGVILTSSIGSGETVNFGDLETDPSFQRSNLEEALAHLSDQTTGGDLKATVYMDSATDIEVDIASINIIGTARVQL